jgi:hypothetical protein
MRERLKAFFAFPFVILFLLLFLGAGIDMVLHPRRHMKHWGVWLGGADADRRRESEAPQIKVLGVLFACLAVLSLFWFVRSACF